MIFNASTTPSQSYFAILFEFVSTDVRPTRNIQYLYARSVTFPIYQVFQLFVLEFFNCDFEGSSKMGKRRGCFRMDENYLFHLGRLVQNEFVLRFNLSFDFLLYIMIGIIKCFLFPVINIITSLQTKIGQLANI